MRSLLVVFLCVLIAVALVDGKSKEKNDSRSKEHHSNSKHSSEEDSGKSKKDSSGSDSDEDSGSVEKGGHQGVISYYYYSNKGTVIYNKQTQTVLYIDFQSEYHAWYCGNTGVIYLYVRQTRRLLVITSEIYETWTVKTKSFEAYFGNIIVLKDLDEKVRRSAVAYSSATITRRIETSFVKVTSTLSIDYKRSCRAFQYVEETSEIYYESRVDNFEKVYAVSKQEVQLYGDARWYAEVTRGGVVFLRRIEGGWETVVKKNVKFELQVLLKSESGFGSFNYYSRKLAAGGIDVSREFKNDLSREVGFFGLLASLQGDVFYGYSGFIYVIYGCVSYASGEISQQYLEAILLTYFTDKRAVRDYDYGKAWESSITETKQTIEALKWTESSKVLYTLLINIQKKTWYINDTDMVAVIQIIIKTSWSRQDVGRVVKKLKEKRKGSKERDSKEKGSKEKGSKEKGSKEKGSKEK